MMPITASICFVDDELAPVEMQPYHVEKAPLAEPLAQPVSPGRELGHRLIGINQLPRFAAFEIEPAVEQRHVELVALGEFQRLEMADEVARTSRDLAFLLLERGREGEAARYFAAAFRAQEVAAASR